MNSRSEYVLQWWYCNHKWVMLSQWKIINDTVVCPFHGYAYWIDGICDRKIASLRTYTVMMYLWIIWYYHGNWTPIYHPQDHVKEILWDKNPSDFISIDVFDETYHLPTSLLLSNFYDIGHFKYFHWVQIETTNIRNLSDSFTYEAQGIYTHFKFFQKTFFKFFPNIVKNIISYKNNFTVAHHVLLTKKWNVVFEYYGIYPCSPIDDTRTRIVSSILVKKWFIAYIAQFFSRFLLSKAGNSEYTMLLWANHKILQLTNEDEILKNFLEFYKKEHDTVSF